MRRLSAIAALALLLSCGAAAAQTLPTPGAPPLGLASPLGIPGASGAARNVGIGLGATEINSAGVSPAVSPYCGSTGPSPALSGFDGGGMSGAAATSCAASSVPSSGGTAALPSAPGTPLAGGSIPLGATELGNAGISPLIGVAAPGVVGCAGAVMAGTPPMGAVC